MLFAQSNYMIKLYLQLMVFILSLVIGTVVPASAENSCTKIYSTRSTQFDRHWLVDIEEKYRNARDSLYQINSFWPESPDPYHKWAYRLAVRHAAGEDHAVLAQKHLGFELLKDKYSSVVMRPPKSLALFIKNFEKWKKEIQIKPEDNLELVFIFIKSNLNRLPTKFDDYLIVRASEAHKPGVWPDPALYKNISDSYFNSQLPPNVFIELFSRGLFQVPGGVFFDHEVAHLTELLSQSAQGKDSLIAQIRQYGYRQRQKKTIDEKKKFRESLLFEFFALPEITKSDQIEKLARQYGFSKGATLETLVKSISNKLSALPQSEMLTTVEAFAKNVSPLIYRQGGASRDSYGFYENHAHFSLHNVMLEENGIQVPPDPEVNLLSPRRVSTDSLIGYLRDLETGFPELRNSRSLSTTLYYMEHSWSPKMKVSPEEYRRMAVHFFAARMSRILMALTTALDLGLTPVQTHREGLSERFNPNSALGQYLDSYLPKNSPIREAFNLIKKEKRKDLPNK